MADGNDNDGRGCDNDDDSSIHAIGVSRSEKRARAVGAVLVLRLAILYARFYNRVVRRE